MNLPTLRPKQVMIKAIFADYGNERGSIVIDSELLCSWFEDRRALNLAATSSREADIEAVKARWKAPTRLNDSHKSSSAR